MRSLEKTVGTGGKIRFGGSHVPGTLQTWFRLDTSQKPRVNPEPRRADLLLVRWWWVWTLELGRTFS